MNIEDMCSNKLIALTERNRLANRDIYDIHFILKKGFRINEALILEKTRKSLKEYGEYCIEFLQSIPKNHSVLDGL
jgi:predicted nucleotidyltransferase component of viral defense system